MLSSGIISIRSSRKWSTIIIFEQKLPSSHFPVLIEYKCVSKSLYFHGHYSKKHAIDPPHLTIKARTRYTTYTIANHTHSFRIPSVRSSSRRDSSCKPEFRETYSKEDISLFTIILTCPTLKSNVIPLIHINSP